MTQTLELGQRRDAALGTDRGRHAPSSRAPRTRDDGRPGPVSARASRARRGSRSEMKVLSSASRSAGMPIDVSARRLRSSGRREEIDLSDPRRGIGREARPEPPRARPAARGTAPRAREPAREPRPGRRRAPPTCHAPSARSRRTARRGRPARSATSSILGGEAALALGRRGAHRERDDRNPNAVTLRARAARGRRSSQPSRSVRCTSSATRRTAPAARPRALQRRCARRRRALIAVPREGPAGHELVHRIVLDQQDADATAARLGQRVARHQRVRTAALERHSSPGASRRATPPGRPAC